MFVDDLTEIIFLIFLIMIFMSLFIYILLDNLLNKYARTIIDKIENKKED